VSRFVGSHADRQLNDEDVLLLDRRSRHPERNECSMALSYVVGRIYLNVIVGLRVVPRKVLSRRGNENSLMLSSSCRCILKEYFSDRAPSDTHCVPPKCVPREIVGGVEQRKPVGSGLR